MIVGIIRLRVRLPGNHSLKGKRRVVKSLIGQVRSRFNVAVSEIALNDVWQRAEIGISTIGNSQSIINSVLDKILEFIEKTCLVEVLDTDIEIINMGK
ncbi:MAG TPA: DUF503 domain-containing protein [Deltaproteobacteria bacterium]|nr:DUF503 domain-containing protein [Deltaproteobacteria bacterium]HDH98820.1 DUF503 domain-containing protein [Deltaproteobacteria bacterium]